MQNWELIKEAGAKKITHQKIHGATIQSPIKCQIVFAKAPHEMNLPVEQCYLSPQPFKRDDKRLEYLFKLNKKMIAEEAK